MIPSFVKDSHIEWLKRFNETSEDSQGYDVPKHLMGTLAKMGLIRWLTGSYYELTDFGMYVLEHDKSS